MMMNDDPMLQASAGQPTPEEVAAQAVARQARVQQIGSGMYAELAQRKALRLGLEQEWINAEYAYEGVYTPDQSREIKGTSVYVNITRSKTNAFAAHLADMEMPGTDDKCWAVDASAKPILTQTSGDKSVVGKTPEGHPVQMGDISSGVLEEAKSRAKNMEILCEDQLQTCGYNAEFRKALFYGSKYGTIIMRGPTKSSHIKRVWQQVEGATYEQVDSEDNNNQPTYEAVNPFHFYPESFAREVKHSERNFETFFLTGAKLRRMAKAGFDKEALEEVLETEKKMGIPPQWYTALAGIASGNNGGGSAREASTVVKGLYEVWLCTCELSGDDLVDLIPNAEPSVLDSLSVSIWGVGDIIIKAEINPLDTGDGVYSVAQMIENANSIFGHGIPWAGANAQESLNAAWRMIIDNGAAASIPAVAVWKSRVRPADGNYEFKPGKTWYMTTPEDDSVGVDDVRKVIQYIDHPVKLDQLLAILKTAKEMFDEEVAFSLVMQGETGPYTPDTASATNTHYNSGRIVLRRVAVNIDDNVTVPNIQRLIDWNMLHSDDESVKGDLQPIARGSSVLMERMEQLQAMNQAMPVLLNPQFRHVFDQDKVLEEYATNLRLSGVLRTDEDRKKIAQEMAQQAQQGQQQGDPARMGMVKVAEGKLQLETQKHADLMKLEEAYIQLEMQANGITREEAMSKLAAHKMTTDSQNQRFNTELAVKTRMGSGI